MAEEQQQQQQGPATAQPAPEEQQQQQQVAEVKDHNRLEQQCRLIIKVRNSDLNL